MCTALIVQISVLTDTASGLHSLLDNHDLSRLDHGRHRVSLFQFQLFRAFARDDGINQILANTNCDMRHNISKSDFSNFALQLIPRTDSHEMFSRFEIERITRMSRELSPRREIFLIT